MILLPLLLALPPLGLRRPAPLARRCAPPVAAEALVPRNRVACYGCGAELQADVAGSPGYMEPERYEMKRKRRQLRESLCDRCRRLSSGEILPAVVEGRLKRPSGAAVGEEGRGITTPEALRGVLLPLRERPALIALLVDLTDVAGTLLPRVRELVGGNPILLIGTKLDLLPRGTEPERVADWLSGAARKIGGVVDVHLVSSKSGDGLQAAARALLAERRGRDLFLLGAANVGKSAFLQSLLPLVSPATPRHLPLSASTPGTTLSLLPIDCFSGGSQLYDTPGVHLHHRMSARLLPAELAMTMPRGRMRPYTPREAAAEGTSFFWGGLARIDVVSAPPALRLTFCTGGSRLRLHECPTAEAAEAHAARAGIEWTPPQDAASAAELGELQLVRTARLRLTPCEQAADLAISGLGWVSVGCLPTLQQGALEATLAVWVPRGVEVFVRPPMPVGGLPTVGSEA